MTLRPRVRWLWVALVLVFAVAAGTVWLVRSPLAGQSDAWRRPATSAEIARCIRDRACHQVFVVAHRAEGFGGVENSRAAVSGAVEAGVPVVEIDLRQSLDGDLFVIHDSKVDRSTTDHGRVEEKTSGDMARMRLLNGESVPRFEEIYAITRGRAVLSVDFKTPAEAIERTADWIAAHGSFDDLIFFVNTGEESAAAARAKQRHPQMIAVVRLLGTRVTVDSTRTAFGGRLPEILHTERVGAAEVASLHALGVKVYVNALPIERYYEPVRFLVVRSLLGTGVDFVLTGRPGSIMPKLASDRPTR